VIGQVHPDTEPALAMLKSEGFSYQGYVDIFDAGPVECETGKIRACATASPGAGHRHARVTTPFIIHNRKREDCRITAAPARLAAGAGGRSADRQAPATQRRRSSARRAVVRCPGVEIMNSLYIAGNGWPARAKSSR
jgi:arginine/ornithine N-succinyltransferase beta subunit